MLTMTLSSVKDSAWQTCLFDYSNKMNKYKVINSLIATFTRSFTNLHSLSIENTKSTTSPPIEVYVALKNCIPK